MQNFYIFILLLLLLSVPKIFAQACCSAGVPLLGSLELPATPKGQFNAAMTFEQNSLQSVLAGNKLLDDNLRKRTVQTMLLEAGYGITNRISISVLFSLLQQERVITSPFTNRSPDRLDSGGIGDAVWLLKYNVLPLDIISQRELSIGIGPKLPIGNSTVRQNGIFIPADMQPGSGAWDAVFWAYFYQGFLPITRINIFGNISGRITGNNAREYKFGNEYIATISSSYRTDYFFDFSMSLQYRTTSSDQFQGNDIANTGGSWYNFIPGVNLKVTNQISSRLSAHIPLYRHLNGTQLTTSYRAIISLFYTFSKSSKV